MPDRLPQNVFAKAIHSPFARLKTLLDGTPPGRDPIDLTIGEPRHAMPPFVMEKLVEASAGYGKYPMINGTTELRQAISEWLGRRYGLGNAVDPDKMIHPLNGSREGLFFATFPALDRREKLGRPAVLIPNPFYQTYLAATLAAGAEPAMLPASAANGFLPDLDALEKDTGLLSRTIAFYLCSPANPQGAVASAAYWERAIRMARKHDFILLADECYSEIYAAEPPAGALQVAIARTGSPSNVIAFNSLSKRSNLPGLRIGFAAGDPEFLARYSQFRNVSAPQLPLPTQHAGTAVWREESHVEANRALYRDKFDAAAELLGNRFGNVRPAGGFFLWLDMSRCGGGEAAALTLWKRTGVKVLPGAYLTYGPGMGSDPGLAYVRVALVQDLATTRQALGRIVEVFA